MSVSNLTNTIWVFKSSVDLNVISGGGNGSVHHSITFISNNITYSELSIYKSTSATYTYNLYYDNTSVLHANWSPTDPWTNSTFRIIKITGGTDATNSSLIQWLEANATQVQVTDLTNTKWVLNVDTSVSGSSFTANLNFTSNSQNFTSFTGNYDIYGYHLKFDNTYVFERHIWANTNYRIISITGGTDVTNPDVIVYLTKYLGVAIFVEDLTNTTWVFKEDLVWGDAQYAINFTSNNLSFKGIKYQVYSADIDRLFYINADDSELKVSEYDADIAGWWTWIDNAYKTIEISNGTDVTNLFLIADLTKNATLQPSVSVKTFDLSTLQLSAGTHTVQVRARAQNYRDSNFSNSVSYSVAPTSHSVAVSVLDESGTYRKRHFSIYDGQDNTGTLLYDSGVSENTNPGTVVCQSGYLYFYLYSTDVIDGSGHTTGNITPSTFTINENGGKLFTVSGDGTIVFDYLDWNA